MERQISFVFGMEKNWGNGADVNEHFFDKYCKRCHYQNTLKETVNSRFHFMSI